MTFEKGFNNPSIENIEIKEENIMKIINDRIRNCVDNENVNTPQNEIDENLINMLRREVVEYQDDLETLEREKRNIQNKIEKTKNKLLEKEKLFREQHRDL